MSQSVMVLIWLVFGVCLVYWCILQPQFNRRLMEKHPATYIQLGRPPTEWQELYRPDEISGVFALNAFILTGEYRQLRDPVLMELGNRIRWVWLLALVAFGSLTFAVVQIMRIPLPKSP